MQLFLSDLHLDDPHSRAFRTFAALIQAEAPGVDAITILGDLCEVWVGDDDDGPLARALIELLSEATRFCPIYLMHGNRDFLFGERFASETGVRLLEDPCLLDDGTLLAHGDAFCIDDDEYQQIRITLRSADWQRSILSQSLTERRALASAMRSQSQQTNANKAQNIMDVADREIERVMREHAATRLIHGHTHRPGEHVHELGKRYVLGAWDSCGWLLRMTSSNIRLECFPLTGRYESATGNQAR